MLAEKRISFPSQAQGFASRVAARFNQTRQPTPGVRLAAHWASAARRGCAIRSPKMLIALLIIALALVTNTNCVAHTFPAELDFSGKSVGEVCDLLTNANQRVRCAAAVSLGYRYHHGIAINPPSWETQHPEFPVPSQLIPNLAQHLAADPDNSVRIASLNALAELKHWTNTTPTMVIGLTNEQEIVRVHTCNALVEVSRESSEALAEGVLPTLAHLLESEAGNEEVWYAAWTAGLLGRAGEPLVPLLQELTKHESSKVRHYAREALSSIQPKKGKSK